MDLARPCLLNRKAVAILALKSAGRPIDAGLRRPSRADHSDPCEALRMHPDRSGYCIIIDGNDVIGGFGRLAQRGLPVRRIAYPKYAPERNAGSFHGSGMRAAVH